MSQKGFFATCAFATLLLSLSVQAQQRDDLSPMLPSGHPPLPSGHLGMPVNAAASVAPDCVVSAVEVVVHPLRNNARIDVGVRVQAVQGGLCQLWPATIQISTLRGENATRTVAASFVDGQLVRPVAMIDAPAGTGRMQPWSSMLSKGQERLITFRYYSEANAFANGIIDPPSRVRMDLRVLGPRVVAGAPVTADVALDKAANPDAKVQAALTTSSGQGFATPVASNAQGVVHLTQTLSKDNLVPVLEWRHEGPASLSAELHAAPTGELGWVTYMREGFAKQFADGLSEPKNDKRIQTAWDTALNAAMESIHAKDPVVIGLGLRSLAWLASGLSPSVITVRSAAETARPDSVVVPDAIAVEASRAAFTYNGATGQTMGLSPLGASATRPALAALTESDARKKEAQAALERLVKRMGEKPPAPPAETASLLDPPPPSIAPPGVKTTPLHVIAFGRNGPYVVAQGGEVTPPSPSASRVVQGFSRRKGLRKALLVLGLLGAAGAGLAWLQTRRSEQAHAQV